MERRALIAVVISLGILIFYQEVVLRRFYTPRTAAPTTEGAEEEAPALPTPAATPLAAQPPALVEEPAPAPPPSADARHITVDTPLYRATFTSLGARLESFALKKYRAAVDPNSPPQEMVVPGTGGALPFGIELRDAKNQLSDASVAYAVQGEDLQLTGTETGNVDFVWHTSGGVVRKRFTFSGDHYDVGLQITAQQLTVPYTELGISWYKGIDVAPQAGSEVVFDRVVFLQGRKLNEQNFGKVPDGKVYPDSSETNPQSIVWAGYAGRHFVSVMVPIDSGNQRLWIKPRKETIEEMMLFPIQGTSPQVKAEVYIGPKDFDALETVGHNLSRAVNLGWFGFIAVPLLHVLQVLAPLHRQLWHRHHPAHRHDQGDLFIPLTQKSFQSMRDMQKLQPQMTKIREQFKDDSEKMNKEIMELYRRHKVNPLGGCLPMVLQIPVFIGAVLGAA